VQRGESLSTAGRKNGGREKKAIFFSVENIILGEFGLSQIQSEEKGEGTERAIGKKGVMTT